MTSEIQRSLFRLLRFTAIHSQDHHLTDYRSADLPDEVREQFARELVAFYERRFEEWKKTAPPDSTGRPATQTTAPDGRLRSRFR